MGFWSKFAHIAAPIADVAGWVVPGMSTVGKVLSKVGKAADVASAVGDVAGGASKSAQGQKNFDTQNQLNWEKLKLEEAKQRPKTALAAALAQNYTPKAIHWNGPGSGLRGDIPTYTGGSQEALSKSIKDPMLAQLLSDTVAGKTNPKYDAMENPKSSAMDKLLGGTAIGGSMAAAIGKALAKRQQPTVAPPPIPMDQGPQPYQPPSEEEWD